MAHVGGRGEILWLGPIIPPDTLAGESSRRNLTLLPIADAETVDRSLATVRAVLLPFDGDRARFRRLIARWQGPVLDSGAAFKLVANTPADIASIAELSEDLSAQVQQILPVSPTRAPDSWVADDIATIAEWCARYEPGPPPSNSLRIEGLQPEDTDRLRPLLARAFYDHGGIKLEPLQGGKTSARVWRVTALDLEDGDCTPWIVKVDTVERIATERENYVNFVQNYVAFPFRPELRRCISGATEGLLVASFIDHAEPLESYLEYGSAPLAIAALFDGPLSLWRRNAREEPIDLIGHYREIHWLPRGTDRALFESIHKRAVVHYPWALPPGELEQMLLRHTDRVFVLTCMTHGDLHPENIFIRRHGREAMLIDFYKTSRQLIMDDPAWLEVNLAMGSALSAAVRDRLFRAPLAPMLDGTFHGSSVTEAIRQVRMHALARCHRLRYYEIAVGSALLRYSRICEEQAPSSQAELAYGLGTRLLMNALGTT